MRSNFDLTVGDINIYHARLIADQQITAVLEFTQILDEEKINKALLLLCGAVPILSYTLACKGSKLKRVNIHHERNEVCTLKDATDRLKEINRFISLPCDPEHEPPLKLLLIRENNADTLCIKIDHILADGGGLKTLLSLFAEAYTSGRITQIINYNRKVGQVIRRFSFFSILKAIRHAKLPIPGCSITQGISGIGESFIKHFFLEPSQYAQLKNKTKLSHSTINDVLLTGLYRAIFSNLPDEEKRPYPVMVPIDMRRNLPSKKQSVIANLSGAVYPALAPIPKEEFDDTLRRVKTIMDGLKQNYPGLGTMLLMTFGALNGGKMIRERYQLAANRGSRFINFTNCGLLDSSCEAFRQTQIKQAYIVGPAQFGSGIIIAISTFNNSLHLTVQGKGDEKFCTFTQNFLESVLSHFSHGQPCMNQIHDFK
jgi:NRPS condensation-like uncharacterized protein